MSNFQLKSGGAQKGFTLIEMSIVLVIIGLIIGGILKGQEIIDASRQKNFISQLDAFRSALNTFQDRYNAIPGDYALATTRISANSVNGTGNGVINTEQGDLAALIALVANSSAGTAGGTAGDSGENMNFFCQLTAANLIGGGSNACNAAATTFGGGSPLPAMAYANSGITVAYGEFDTANARTALWGRVHRSPGAAIADGTSGVLSGRVASQIDAKYDDGLPIGGTIRSAGIGACPASATTSVYTSLSEDPDCALLVEFIR